MRTGSGLCIWQKNPGKSEDLFPEFLASTVFRRPSKGWDREVLVNALSDAMGQGGTFFVIAVVSFGQLRREPSSRHAVPRVTGSRSGKMEFHDKILKCGECGTEFVFTAGEQMFFAEKGFRNEPKRCKACKAKRSQNPGANSGNGQSHRAETRTTCSQCGKETTVPFRPTQGRPVYCRECFQQRRAMGGAVSRAY